MNFKNSLEGIETTEKCFDFLKANLSEKFDYELFWDLLSLPCMDREDKSKLSLLFALLEDNICNDAIVNALCDILNDIPAPLWSIFKENLIKIFQIKHFIFNRSQKLQIANTIEIMYAKGYDDAWKLAELVYQTIGQPDNEFIPDSEENMRIKLAKIAYSTNKHNYHEKFHKIALVKNHIKVSKRKYLMGVLNYYKGLCLKFGGITLDYKDSKYYMSKSRNRGFSLANIYLNYNIETSK